MKKRKKAGYIGFLPIVHTDDLPATARYYRDVLGFVIDEDLIADDFIMLWAADAKQKTWNQLGLMSRVTRRSQGKGQVIGIAVEGIETMFKRVKKKGAKILFEVEDREWGCKEFGVEDPNGYHLYFRESGF